MSPHKRQKLYRKRTPWFRTRYASTARGIQTIMRLLVLEQARANINRIRSTVHVSPAKAGALAEATIAGFEAVVSVPLPGSAKQ